MNLRTTDDIRTKLEAAALEAGRNLTQEVEWRVERSFEWERAFGEVQAMLREHKAKMEEVAKGNLKAEMERQGWKKIAGFNGKAWFEPGTAVADSIPSSGFSGPAADEPEPADQPASANAAPAATPADNLEETIFKAVVRAIRASRESGPGA